MARIGMFDKPFPRHVLMLCALVLLAVSSCAAGFAAKQKSFIEGLDADIGIATVDDLIAVVGPPQQSTETPEGTWYTWRKANSGAVSGGVSLGFFGISLGAPVETGEELNCLFDRDTGKLSDYDYRQW